MDVPAIIAIVSVVIQVLYRVTVYGINQYKRRKPYIKFIDNESGAVDILDQLVNISDFRRIDNYSLTYQYNVEPMDKSC
jgi:hypothetical protein